MWYYKARIYSPTLGRFMQTDPIGYQDGMNWYNYVGSDPVNFSDTNGLGADRATPHIKPIDVFGTRPFCLFCQDLLRDRIISGPNLANYSGGKEFAATDSAEGPQKDEQSDGKTDGWQCAGDVAKGAVETTALGTLLSAVGVLTAHPEKRYSGDNADGRKLPRGKSLHAKAVAKGVGKAGLVGAVIGGIIGGASSYSDSENCPEIF